jgi:hypothetical protein
VHFLNIIILSFFNALGYNAKSDSRVNESYTCDNKNYWSLLKLDVFEFLGRENLEKITFTAIKGKGKKN